MENNKKSKVWPVLADSGGPLDTGQCSEPKNCSSSTGGGGGGATKTKPHQRVFFPQSGSESVLQVAGEQNWIKRNKSSSGSSKSPIGQIISATKCPAECICLTNGWSEVCFVCGVIMAMTGALIALSGIFTRNQTKIRLYMECFGCSMVIVSVLMVLLSLKMRADREAELKRLGSVFTFHNHHKRPAKRPMQKGTKIAKTAAATTVSSKSPLVAAMGRTDEGGDFAKDKACSGGGDGGELAFFEPSVLRNDNNNCLKRKTFKRSAPPSPPPISMAEASVTSDATIGIGIGIESGQCRQIEAASGLDSSPIKDDKDNEDGSSSGKVQAQEQQQQQQRSSFACTTLKAKSANRDQSSSALLVSSSSSSSSTLLTSGTRTGSRSGSQKWLALPAPPANKSMVTIKTRTSPLLSVAVSGATSQDGSEPCDSGANEEVEVDEEEKLEDFNSILTTIDWTPHCGDDSDDEFGNSHETATIEAALSIVSTAATLAGFHPDAQNAQMKLGAYGRHERFCCLHHIVQGRLSARKWVKWLRIAHAVK